MDAPEKGLCNVSTSPLDILKEPLTALTKWLQKIRCPYLVIGGVAASLLGRPRATRDIDLVVLIDSSDWESFLESSKEYGFIPRVNNAIDFAKRSRVLLLKHKESQIEVDISFGVLPFEQEAIQRAKVVSFMKVRLPLPQPEDLIIMKAIARRPRDIADIEGLLAAHPNMDTKRIRKWVKEFAKVLEMPEIYKDLEKILKQKN